MKTTPTTKEQLVYFLHNHISLGTYDKKFIDNLVTGYLSTLRPVTSNQNALLDKVTLRYARQLGKMEINAEEMIALPWNVNPIESSPKFTEAYIDLKDNVIEIRSPFKGDFIRQLKEFPFAVWDKTARVWSIPTSELGLRNAVDLLKLHFSHVNYCTEVTTILNEMGTFSSPALIWDPTLVKVNGNFYIASCNESLMESLNSIPLNDSLSTISILNFHGVNIDKSVINGISTEFTVDDICFAVEREPTIEYDIDNIVRKLKLIDADYVLMREWNVIDKGLSKKLKAKLEEENIKVDILDRSERPTLVNIRQARLPVMISGYSFNTSLSTLFAKVVGIVNNNSIEIK